MIRVKWNLYNLNLDKNGYFVKDLGLGSGTFLNVQLETPSVIIKR
jgi:hypothetical protein